MDFIVEPMVHLVIEMIERIMTTVEKTGGSGSQSSKIENLDFHSSPLGPSTSAQSVERLYLYQFGGVSVTLK